MSDPAAVQAERYDLALEEARYAREYQAATLARTRDRAARLLSVGSLAAAFIGGFASQNNAELTAWTTLGLGGRSHSVRAQAARPAAAPALAAPRSKRCGSSLKGSEALDPGGCSYSSASAALIQLA